MSASENVRQIALECSPDAPRDARRALRRWLTEFGIPGERHGDIVLAASELVTNAVVHARSASNLIARLGGDQLRLEVEDGDPTPPVVRPGGDGVGGFGLRVVVALADAWGFEPLPDGKRVWFETSSIGP